MFVECLGKNQSLLWLLGDAFRGDRGFVWQCDGRPRFHPKFKLWFFPLGFVLEMQLGANFNAFA